MGGVAERTRPTRLHGDALGLHVGHGDARVPGLRALQDQVGERVAEEDVLAEVGVGEVVGRRVVVVEVDELLGLRRLAKEELELAKDVLGRGGLEGRRCEVRTVSRGRERASSIACE